MKKIINSLLLLVGGALIAVITIIIIVNINDKRIKATDSDNKLIEEKDDYVKNDDSTVSMSFSDQVRINNKNVSLYFKNPSKSIKDVVLELIIINNNKEISLVKSKFIKPGYLIDKMQITKEIDKGNYDGFFIIHYYNDSGKEEIVNSKISVKINVE